jgi:hypothetical protein
VYLSFPDAGPHLHRDKLRREFSFLSLLLSNHGFPLDLDFLRATASVEIGSTLVVFAGMTENVDFFVFHFFIVKADILSNFGTIFDNTDTT